MREVHRRYLRRFLPAMAVYVALMVAYGFVARLIPGAAPRALLALVPLLPLAVAIRAFVRVLREQDELERRIDLEAIAVAALSTSFGFFTLGLVLGAGGWPRWSAAVALWVLPCFFATYGLAKWWVMRRYLRA